jgi:class 3 adenylate cyclase
MNVQSICEFDSENVEGTIRRFEQLIDAGCLHIRRIRDHMTGVEMFIQFDFGCYQPSVQLSQPCVRLGVDLLRLIAIRSVMRRPGEPVIIDPSLVSQPATVLKFPRGVLEGSRSIYHIDPEDAFVIGPYYKKHGSTMAPPPPDFKIEVERGAKRAGQAVVQVNARFAQADRVDEQGTTVTVVVRGHDAASLGADETAIASTTIGTLGHDVGGGAELKELDKPQAQTVVVVDLIAYADIVRKLEENLGSSATAEIDKQIQALIDIALKAVAIERSGAVIKTTGDGAIIRFQHAETVHRFAEALHMASRDHNAGKTEPIAKRWFRCGAATGDLTATNEYGTPEYSGVTIATATRLQSASKAGELVIDIETFDQLPKNLRKLYAREERVPGKRDEEFYVRRSRMLEVASDLTAFKAKATDQGNG